MSKDSYQWQDFGTVKHEPRVITINVIKSPVGLGWIVQETCCESSTGALLNNSHHRGDDINGIKSKCLDLIIPDYSAEFHEGPGRLEPGPLLSICSE